MFSQTGEYALRVVVFLGARGEAPATTRQIAQATCVPEGYLSKVMQTLGRAGIVNSQRGLHGGFVLAKGPGELSVFDVIQAVDPIHRIESCPLKIASHGVKLCALHRRLDDALGMVEKAFRESTIEDLLADTNPSKPLCEAEGGTKDIHREGAKARRSPRRRSAG